MGCGSGNTTKTDSGATLPPECATFFSRATEATVEDGHLSIVVPENVELVDSIYADETNDLPVEIRCESPEYREILAFHLTFQSGNAALEEIEDERFKLLHTQEGLTEPIRVCIRAAFTGESARVLDYQCQHCEKG
jgi:hypothetical protein